MVLACVLGDEQVVLGYFISPSHYDIGSADKVVFDCFSSCFFLFANDVFEDVIHRFEGPSASLRHEKICPNQRQ